MMEGLVFTFNRLGFHKNEVGVSKGKLNSQRSDHVSSRRTSTSGLSRTKCRKQHLQRGSSTAEITFCIVCFRK